MCLRRRQAFWVCSLLPYGDYTWMSSLALTETTSFWDADGSIFHSPDESRLTRPSLLPICFGLGQQRFPSIADLAAPQTIAVRRWQRHAAHNPVLDLRCLLVAADPCIRAKIPKRAISVKKMERYVKVAAAKAGVWHA